MPGVSRKIYEINTEIFDEWNEISLYLLGFFYACATICRRGDNISMTINNKNVHLLEKINLVMSSTYPIRETRTTNVINIANGTFIKKMEELGLKANGKFDGLYYPEFLKVNNNAALERHFLRGYFDGKGSFAASTKTKKIVSTFSCRNEAFVEDIRDRLVLYGLNRVNITHDKSSTSNYIRYNKVDTTRLYNFLYIGSSIYNTVKRNKYLNYSKEFYTYNKN